MAQRNRRRNPPRQAKPGTAVAVRPKAEVAQVVHQPPVFVSTYGEPAAERILTSFEQYCELAYGGNSVIFGLLNVQMRLFSEARLCWRSLDDRKMTYTPGEQLEKLRKPWPNGFTGDMLARMRQDAAIAGNAYVRDCGDRLERLRPDWVTIVSWVTTDAFGRQVREVLGFMYEPTGDPERVPDWYPVEEVAHWAPIPDPLANFRGMSWFTPALREINADRAMTEHREKFWRNAATPNIIIKYSGKIAPSQKIGLAESIAAKHGGPDKAGGTLVLDEGADPMIVGSKFSDAQFQEILSLTENRMAVAAGVPALLAGLKEGLDAAAWSMYRQAMRAFADLFVRPDWRSACAALSVLVDEPDGFELWYDTRDIAALQEGEAEQASRLQIEATTINSLITAGFTAESSVKTVSSGDITQLVHTGLVSVQLNKPGEKEEPEAESPENPDGPTDPGGPDKPDDPEGGKPDDSGDDDEESDVDRALVAALTEELARSRQSNEKVMGWALGQLEVQRGWTKDSFDESRVSRDTKGRFGKGLGAVAKALLSGADDALDGFNREQLRREAKRRGVTVPRGAHIDAIKDLLWDHEGDHDAEDVTTAGPEDFSQASFAELRQRVNAMDVPTRGMNRQDLITTLRLSEFARRQGFDMGQGPFGGHSNAKIRQLRQEHQDRIRQIGDAARDVADVSVKGGDVELATARVHEAKAAANWNGSTQTVDALSDMADRVSKVSSTSDAAKIAESVLREAGGELDDGGEVAFDPTRHRPRFGQDVEPGDRVLVMRPGVRETATGDLLALGDVYLPDPVAVDSPTRTEASALGSLHGRIVEAHKRLADDDGHVRLSALRQQLPDISREEFDQAVRDLDRQKGAHLIQVAKQSLLTQADRDGGIALAGGDEKVHDLKIEPGKFDSSSLPDRAPEAPTAPEKPNPGSGSHYSVIIDRLTSARADDAPQIRELLNSLSKQDLTEIARELPTVAKPKRSDSRQRLADSIYLGTVGLRTKQRAVGGVEDPLGWEQRQSATTAETFAAKEIKTVAPAKPRAPRVPRSAPSTPATPVDLPDGTLEALQTAGIDDGSKVRGLLTSMSKAQLAELAKQLGTTVGSARGKSREQLMHDIYDGTVGFRERAKAVGGWDRDNKGSS